MKTVPLFLALCSVGCQPSKNGKSAVVRINDRGPHIKGRIVDVTIGVARQLGMVTAGVVPCKVEVLKK